MIVPVNRKDTPLSRYSKHPKWMRDFVDESFEEFMMSTRRGQMAEVVGFPTMGLEPCPSDAARVETAFKDHEREKRCPDVKVERAKERLFLTRL